MLLSLCMIVKNEEDDIARCLNSVKDIADEIIVVDTGSTDNTVKIAKSFGAKIYNYKWSDSFADARNYSLTKAGGEWILILDADDVLESADTEKLLATIKNSPENVDVYCCQTLCYSGSVPNSDNLLININVRLIRNGRGYQYKGRIHEQISFSDACTDTHKSILATDIRIHHYGYLTSCIKSKKKHERNIALIQKELDDDPQNAFMLFNMGNEFITMNKTEKAIDYYMESYKNFDPKTGFSSTLLIRIIICDESLHRDAELLRFIKLGLKYYPNITDFEFLRASAFYRRGKIEKAIRSYKRCVKMGSPPINTNSNIGVGTYKPHYGLASIYRQLGEQGKALFHCRQAIRYNPNFSAAYELASNILAENGKKPEYIKKRLIKLTGGTNVPYLILSDIFYSRGSYSQALELARQTEKKYPENNLAYYDEGVCLFYLKRYKEAYACLLKADTGASHGKSALFRMLCTIFDSEIPKCDSYFKIKLSAPYYSVLTSYQMLSSGETCSPLAKSTENSQQYVKPIFSLLEILLKSGLIDEFQKAVPILNLITDNGVLLMLGKLYYKLGYTKLAYKELSRSIKLTDKMDAEGLLMMKNSISAA